MRLLEHESKEIMKKYGIAVPAGQVVSSKDEVQRFGEVMLKAQIPLGGRGKGGGVLQGGSREDVVQKIQSLLSSDLRGYRPTRILVEEKMTVSREFFLAIVYDTVAKSPLAIFSTEGGIDIEEVAASQPEKIKKVLFRVRDKLPQYRAREILSEAGVTGKLLLSLGGVFSKLADVFLDYDATVVEINPLALTGDGKLVALDCHMEVEEDSLFRHADLAEVVKDVGRFMGGRISTEFERKASEIDAFDHRGVAGRVIEFDGNLGLIIGGGGASLTAFDSVQLYGGTPANYCEIGGNPSVLKVKELTKHILSKPGVEKIAVIMNVVSNTRVDLVARGVIKGILEAGKKPSETVATFRVPGAWEEEGFKILSKYGVSFCDRTVSIDEAAKMAVSSMKA